MSGMAGNVTAFNTVWTYDIYQSYIRRGASDAHYLWVGRVATVGGVLLSIGAAYVARSFNNIMDVLQLVFAFVNAPLFATFALGHVLAAHHRPWRLCGTGFRHAGRRHSSRIDAACGRGSWGQGRVLWVLHVFPSELAQTFWTAIAAFTTWRW